MASAVSRLLFGAAEVITEAELQERAARRPLRVKLGLDPTAPHVTLGWAVPLRKLRQFQDAGHTAVLIVGDFTARVGDPSGKSETRPRLSAEAVRANAGRVLGQFGRILSEERLEIRYNSEWLESLSMEDVLRLTASYTVARMLERDDFAKRYAEQRPISVMEFLYPLLQGMDSVATESDVELGGHDQLFNLLVGRDLQREYGQPPQIVFTMPLLIGLDGTRAMGQSLGNYVGIDEPAEEMFGKLMSVPDHLIPQYLTLCTDLGPQEVGRLEAELEGGSLHPMEAKRIMAREVVRLYHEDEGAARGEEDWNRKHQAREIPSEEVPTRAVRTGDVFVDGELDVPSLLHAIGLASSKSHGWRLVRQEGVRCRWPGSSDPRGERITDRRLVLGPDFELLGSVWIVGRRHATKVGAVT
jgi:tyrosyl-tRNA synthetase